MTALLEIADLHAGYGPIEVLKGLSLEVRRGDRHDHRGERSWKDDDADGHFRRESHPFWPDPV